MGAAASLKKGILPEDIAELYAALDKVKDDIVAGDVAIIQKESSKLIKNHTNIINTITKSSKSQLRRYIGPLINAEDIEHFVGGVYGKFLALLCASKEHVCERLVEFATKGIGCDQSALVSGICILSGSCIKKLSASLEHSCGSTLTTIIAGNTKKRSALQNFLLRIATGSRNDMEMPNKDVALTQAQVMNTFTINSVDDVFDIICTFSREQCKLIDQICRTSYHISLEEIINEKLSGSIAKAVILWILPAPEAMAYAIKENAKNSTTVGYLIASMTKNETLMVDAAMRSRWQKSLHDMIDGILSGKLKAAALSWMDKMSFDGGYEEQLEDYVNLQLAQGSSLIDILHNQQHAMVIKDLLQKQVQAYVSKGYLIQANVADEVHPSINSTISSSPTYPTKAYPVKLLSSTSISVIKPSSPTTKPLPSSLTSSKPAPISTELSDKIPIDRMVSPRVAKLRLSERHIQSHNFEEANLIQVEMKEEVRLATQYIRMIYASYDAHQHGSVQVDVFWQFFAALGLESMGYTVEERKGIREWCDWSIDGQVALADALHELVDLIINGIENQGLNTAEELQHRISSIAPNHHNIRMITPRFHIPTPRVQLQPHDDNGDVKENVELIPPDLYQYIWDTFDAYDTQKRGMLDASEFWQLLTAMNLGFTDSDIDIMQLSWDKNHDGFVKWEEAMNPLIELITSMINEYRDHWIGLVDRSSQALFWYNLRDQSSQWMDEADQVAYKAGNFSRGDNFSYAMSPAKKLTEQQNLLDSIVINSPKA